LGDFVRTSFTDRPLKLFLHKQSIAQKERRKSLYSEYDYVTSFEKQQITFCSEKVIVTISVKTFVVTKYQVSETGLVT